MAVHTKLSKNELLEILSKYKIGELVSFEGITEGIENTNYIVKTTKNRFILTVFEDRINYNSIPFYIKIMKNSSEEGINCPVAIKDIAGNYTNKLKKKEFGIFTFISGKSKKIFSEENCYDIGKIMASFHQANKNFDEKQPNNYSLSFWNSLFEDCKSFVNNAIPGSYNIIDEEIKFVNKHWPKRLPKGIIHADMFPDNVLFHSNNISGVIDFYFSCYDFLSYDLAILINSWCFHNNKFSSNLARQIIVGYESVRKINKNEKNAFNILLRGACLRFLLTRIQDSKRNIKNKILAVKNPGDFYERLLFHKNVNGKYDFF